VVDVEVKQNKEHPEEETKDATQGPQGRPQEGNEPEAGEEKTASLEEMDKPELMNKIKEVQDLAEQNYDLYVRSQAEMDNMRKRFQREKDNLIKFSNESLIKQLLPVLDSLEKAVDHSREGDSLEALREGVELTLKGLTDTLEKAGLEEVKAVDQPFDPNYHEAVSTHEDDSVEAGTVLKELQKGYLLNQRLIRPAMVVVSQNSSRSEGLSQKDS